MFDNGVVDPSEQLHQFIASSTRASLPLPLPHIPLSSSSSSSFPNLRPFDHHHHHHHHHHSYNIINPQSQELAQLHQPPPNQLLHPSVVLLHRERNDQDIKESTTSSNIEIEREHLDVDPWSNDELLALLRVRSTMENWFPEFIWEHVSRELAEAGFKRSAEKCKEKFEEESSYFNNVNNLNKNFRFLNELEQLYQPQVNQVQPQPHNPSHHEDHQVEKNNVTLKEVVEELVEKPSEEEKGDQEESPSNDQTMSDNNNNKEVKIVTEKSKKRKRKRRFEMMKGFCEDIVNKLMCQQEEIHSKLLEDMVRRDEEKLAKEEAWKKQEMDRMNKELEAMAKEQAFASDRKSTIIEFLKKFTSSISSSTKTTTTTNPSQGQKESDGNQEPIFASSTMVPCASKPHKPSTTIPSTPTSLTEAIAPQSPSSTSLTNLNTITNLSLVISSENASTDHLKPRNPSSNVEKGTQDIRKRWPRDEVLALINLRCSLFNNVEQNNDKDNNRDVIKAPLWERISQGMLEMGYNRNAKRCKEKWENINKYFRKTKNVNKKRSLDSRTCPYFHQLNTLYNQGILVPPPSDVVALLPPPENKDSSSLDEGEKNNVVQHPAALDFEL